MPTTVTTTIGTGETHTTIASWETNVVPADLTADDEVHIGEIKDETFSESAIISGHTTDATRYIQLRATSGTGFDGTVGSGAIIQTSATSANINLEDDYIRIGHAGQGFEIHCEGANNAFRRNNGSATGDHRATDLLIHGDTDAGGSAMGRFDVQASSTEGPMLATNCILYDNDDWGFLGISGGSDEARYCTAVKSLTDASNSFDGFANYKVTNCAALHYGNGSSRLDFRSLNTGSSNYASSDSSGDTLTGLTATDEFVDANTSDFSTWDLHLKSGSNLEGQGTPIAGVTVDIDGDSRDGTSPDIGADEFVAAATGAKPPSGLALLGVGA